MKAVNIQVSWGDSSAWTRPSAPECGDSLKAPASDVDTEKVLREARWVREAGRGETAHGLKGVRPGVRLKNRTVRAGRSPKNTSAYAVFTEQGSSASQMTAA